MRPATKAWVAMIEERYALTDGGEVLLHEAAALRDRIAEAEEAVARDGFTVHRANGTIQVHPAVRIAQDARSLLLRHLIELDLEGSDG